MMYPLKQLALAAASLCITGSALAAQPAGGPSGTLPQGPDAATQFAPPAPGTLKVFKAMAGKVTAGQPLAVRFEGSGYCKVKLNGGDGYVRDYEGTLPFDATYTYGTASMSSFEVSKDYTATAAAAGNCKTTVVLPGVKVTVMNPAPQSANASGNPNPVMSGNVLTMGKPKPKP